MAEPHVLGQRQSAYRQRQTDLFLKPCSQGPWNVPKPQHRFTLAVLEGSCRARQPDPPYTSFALCLSSTLDFIPCCSGTSLSCFLREDSRRYVTHTTQHAFLLLCLIQTIIWFQSCGQRTRLLKVSLQVFLLTCAAQCGPGPGSLCKLDATHLLWRAQKRNVRMFMLIWSRPFLSMETDSKTAGF